LWILFVALFFSFLIYRGDFAEALINESSYDDMYKNVWLVQDQLFINLCKHRIKIQQCTDEDKKIIFRDEMPPKAYFDVAGYLEENFNCSGYGEYHLKKYCFSNSSKYNKNPFKFIFNYRQIGNKTCNDAFKKFMNSNI